MQIGRSSDQLALQPSGFFEQDLESAADAGADEGGLASLDYRLQTGKAFDLDCLIDLVLVIGGRGSGRGECLKENAPAANLVNDPQGSTKSASVSPGKPTMKSEVKAISGRAARNRAITAR
jgi:hypothetical protein